MAMWRAEDFAYSVAKSFHDAGYPASNDGKELTVGSRTFSLSRHRNRLYIDGYSMRNPTTQTVVQAVLDRVQDAVRQERYREERRKRESEIQAAARESAKLNMLRSAVIRNGLDNERAGLVCIYLMGKPETSQTTMNVLRTLMRDPTDMVCLAILCDSAEDDGIDVAPLRALLED